MRTQVRRLEKGIKSLLLVFKLSSQRHLAELVLLAKLIQFILYIPQYLARSSKLYICYYDFIVCIVVKGHSSIPFQYCIPPFHSTDCRQPDSQQILCMCTSDINEGLKLGSYIKHREEWTEDFTADSAQMVSVATPSPLGTRLEYSNMYRRSRKQYTTIH